MPKEDNAAEWIAVDWGTSQLRAWAMRGATPIDHATSDKGMGKLDREQFEHALLELITGWLGTETIPVVACGMVGARQGWQEVPYQPVPCKPLSAGSVLAPAHDPRLNVHILPGLSQSSPPDVMRGEETQIAGFLALNPGWDGVLCLPGTHTKWVHISADEVVSFQTCMTGELFALLGEQSVLRHTVGGSDWNDDAFADALDDIRSRPERLATLLFALRAQDLLQEQKQHSARARLSGLLIGAELAATRAYWLGQQVAVIGTKASAMPYAKALELQGVPAMISDGDKMTLTGLTTAWRKLRETGA